MHAMTIAAVLAAVTFATASSADTKAQVGPDGSVSLVRRATRPHVEPLDEGDRAEASLLQGGSAGDTPSAVASSGEGAVGTIKAHGENASEELPTGLHTESSLGNLVELNGSDGTLLGGKPCHLCTVALIGGKDGKYCADEGNLIQCTRNAIGSWEKFRIHHHGSNRWALQGGKNRMYCSDNHLLSCTRYGVNSWEKFTIQSSGGKYTLRGGRDGKYCADEGFTGVKCNRGEVGAWEKFKIVNV